MRLRDKHNQGTLCFILQWYGFPLGTIPQFCDWNRRTKVDTISSRMQPICLSWGNHQKFLVWVWQKAEWVYRQIVQELNLQLWWRHKCTNSGEGGISLLPLNCFKKCIHFSFTGGAVSDCSEATALLSKVTIKGSDILADKAYGTVEIRTYITENGATYTIPPKSNTVEPWECDYSHYKERHVVECFFQKLKQFRRVATRYDKLIACFKGFVYLACVMILAK